MPKFTPFASSTLALALLASLANAQATQTQQTDAVRRGAGDTSIFAPLTLDPEPTAYRSAGGVPGPAYWQNHADYDLHATLDTTAQMVHGTMTLRYTNHSPDTLKFLWFQTEQNIFRGRSLSRMTFPENGDSSVVQPFQGGETIERFEEVRGGQHIPLTLRDQETMTEVALPRPLAPGQTITIEAAWHYKVPDRGAIRGILNGRTYDQARRTAREGSLYEIAQWYPRMCVYDDVHGWNTDPYLGWGEFYLEYGDFNVSITVPAGYVVASTGALQNPTEVLTPTELARWHQAAHSTTPVSIVTGADASSGTARPTAGTRTWRFLSHNVRDAVWAAAPNYQWDAVSWNGILAQSYYRPSAAATWHQAADMARMSIQEYSERWLQYPYPQVSVVEGHVYGNEYPMLSMIYAAPDTIELYRVLTHEVGHNWVPMIVGSNERRHFWQDEGFNTFINTFSEARRFPSLGDQTKAIASDFKTIEQVQIRNIDSPIEIPADRMNPTTGVRDYTEYDKTAVALQILREQVLGPAAFDDGFRTYMHTWAYKHPTPADFFRIMENVGGRRLDWFWREWFYEDPHFDQAIDTVTTRQDGDTLRMAVRYSNLARGVLPILARFTFSDGTTQDFIYPAEVWSVNSKYYVRHYAFGGKKVTRIDLDPDQRLIDVDRNNNTWIAR